MKINIIKPFETLGYNMDAKVIQQIIPTSKICTNTAYYKKALINFFIQDVNNKNLLKNAKYNLVIINQELFFHRGVNKNSPIYQIDYILCKTDIALKIAKHFKNKYNFKYKIYKLGFTTIFPKMKITKTYNEMLHSAGSHHWKQTDTILKLWLKHPELPKITIICEKQCYDNIKNIIKNKNLPKNIKLYKELLPIKEYVKLKNKIGIHIVPSLTEGYGHYINEARIIGSTILTSNYPPMNELVDSESGILVDCSKLLLKRNKTKICYINENDLLVGVQTIINLSNKEKEKLGNNAYNKYIKDKKYFTRRLKLLVKKLNNKNTSH